jgi:NADPH:quinone reductase-like Zn-dependent oxidoreductase
LQETSDVAQRRVRRAFLDNGPFRGGKLAVKTIQQMALDGALAKARMFWDLLVGARLRGRRGTFYGITLWYRKDPKPFHEDLPKILALVAHKEISPVIAATFPLGKQSAPLNCWRPAPWQERSF